MNRIRLPRDGAEYAHFYFSERPDGATFEAQIGEGAWNELDMTGGPVPRLLLRGPDAEPGPGIVVTDGGIIRVRISDVPEIILRGAGYIALVG